MKFVDRVLNWALSRAFESRYHVEQQAEDLSVYMTQPMTWADVAIMETIGQLRKAEVE